MLPLWTDERPMNLDDMKKEAALAADAIDIRWDKLENPEYADEFERVLRRASSFVGELEGLYLKLNAGESVAFPGTDTPLKYDELEKYRGIVQDELFDGYILQALYHKYTAIQNVMQAALDNPAPDQLDLGI